MDGEKGSALDLSARVLARAAYETSAPMTARQLERRGITRHQLRRQAMLLLLELIPNPDTEALLDWGTRARGALLVAATALPNGKPDGRRIKGPKKSLTGACSTERGPAMSAQITTVHGAKGETHHTTVYYAPKSGPKKCPSVQWWPDGEERRITFVACSRPEDTLILCVHRDSYNRLLQQQAKFVALFEVQTMAEWLEKTG